LVEPAWVEVVEDIAVEVHPIPYRLEGLAGVGIGVEVHPTLNPCEKQLDGLMALGVSRWDIYQTSKDVVEVSQRVSPQLQPLYYDALRA
jgi:hypothetical protein